MTLQEAVTSFEALFTSVSEEIGFPCEPGTADGIRGDGRDWSRAPDGQKYVAVVHYGIKPEGVPFTHAEPTRAAAIANWHSTVMSMEVVPGAVLFWRDRPSVDLNETRNGWYAYSRFAISAGPGA